MEIIKPTASQLKECYALEMSYPAKSSAAEKSGFFLPGTQFSLYEELLETGYIRCIADKENVASCIVAAPPGHPIVLRMLDNKALALDGHLKPNPSASVWIAKIMSGSRYKRQGYSAALYQLLFKDFPNVTFWTATALSPLRNVPSEEFQISQGLKTCGTFLSGKKGNIDNVVSQVWIKT